MFPKRNRKNLLILALCALILLFIIFFFTNKDSSIADDEATTTTTIIARSASNSRPLISSSSSSSSSNIQTTNTKNHHKNINHQRKLPPRDYPRILGHVPMKFKNMIIASSFSHNVSTSTTNTLGSGSVSSRSNSSGSGGYNAKFPTSRIWLMVKKRDAWNWFNEEFPMNPNAQVEMENVPMLPTDREVMNSWSCGVGQVNNFRDETLLGSFEVKIWKMLTSVVVVGNSTSSSSSKNNNEQQTLGKGWFIDSSSGSITHHDRQQKVKFPEIRRIDGRALALGNPCETKAKAAQTVENARKLSEAREKQKKILEKLKSYPNMTTLFWQSLQNETRAKYSHDFARAIENNNTNNSTIIPSSLNSRFESFIKNKHKKYFPVLSTTPLLGTVSKSDLQAKSISLNQLNNACVDDVIALDGRAPSFAHAMSRRCANPFEVAKKNIFFMGIGHSHTRYLFGMLCMIGGHDWCHEFSLFHFHMPVYPVYNDQWWLKQPLLKKFLGSSSNSSSTLSSSSNSSTFSGRPHNNGVQFRLFYSAAWYDPRTAVIRALKKLISDPEKYDNASSTQNIKPPNITIFYTPDFGLAEHKDLMKKWDEELDAWIDFVKPFLAVTPTHFVLSRGEWDFHFMSPDLSAIANQTTNLMLLIHKHFPDAVIFLQLPQRHIHYKIPQQPFRLRAVCASEARVQLLREANLCAAYQAVEKNIFQNEGNNNRRRITTLLALRGSSLLKKLVIFDSDVVTKSYLGHAFVDPAGHHYNDVALEVLALEMRLIASDSEVQALYSKRAWYQYLSTADKFCKKINDDFKHKKTPNTQWNNDKFIKFFNTTTTTTSSSSSASSKIENMIGKSTSSSSSSSSIPGVNVTKEAIDALLRLPMSNNFGFPAEIGTKEMLCTCHQEFPEVIVKDPVRNMLCGSIKVSPKEFTAFNRHQVEMEMKKGKKQQQQQQQQQQDQ